MEGTAQLPGLLASQSPNVPQAFAVTANLRGCASTVQPSISGAREVGPLHSREPIPPLADKNMTQS